MSVESDLKRAALNLARAPAWKTAALTALTQGVGTSGGLGDPAVALLRGIADAAYAKNHPVVKPPTPIPVPTPTPTPVPVPPPPPSPPPPSPPPPSPPTGAVYNARDYGAKADGVTDDAPAIKKAMDACAAAGGGTVYLPAGRYFLSAGWDLPSQANAQMKCHIPVRANCTVAGDGIGVTILDAHFTTEVGRSCLGAAEVGNVGAHDLSITSPLSQYASQYKGGFKLMGVNGAVLSNLDIENVAIASNAVGCSNVAYDHCTAHHTKYGFMCDMQPDIGYPVANGITYTDCESYDATDGSLGCGFEAYFNEGDDTHRVTNVSYVRCYAHDNNNSGLYGYWTQHLTCVDCRFVDNGSYGIWLRASKDYFVSGLVATGNSSGVGGYPEGSTARSAL